MAQTKEGQRAAIRRVIGSIPVSRNTVSRATANRL